MPLSRQIAVVATVLCTLVGRACHGHMQDRQIDGEHGSGTLLLMIAAELVGGDTTALAGFLQVSSSHSAYFLAFTGSPVVDGRCVLFYPPKDAEDPGLAEEPYQITAEHQYAFNACTRRP